MLYFDSGGSVLAREGFFGPSRLPPTPREPLTIRTMPGSDGVASKRQKTNSGAASSVDTISARGTIARVKLQ